MVTSCHTESECGWLQIIVKEKGVFSNVTSPSTKAKLRLLFEVAPLALLVSLHPERKDCVFRRQFDKSQVLYWAAQESPRSLPVGIKEHSPAADAFSSQSTASLVRCCLREFVAA